MKLHQCLIWVKSQRRPPRGGRGLKCEELAKHPDVSVAPLAGGVD